MGDALHQTVEVIEVVEGAVVFDIVVAAAIGVDGNLYVGEAKAAADDLVEGAVAATGVETDLVVGVVGTPAAHPGGGIAWGLSQVDLIVELGVGGGIGLDFVGEDGRSVLLAGTRIDDKDVFHNKCKNTNNN